jgi:hypothetical protein
LEIRIESRDTPYLGVPFESLYPAVLIDIYVYHLCSYRRTKLPFCLMAV